MVVSRRKSSLPILHSSFPSVFWNMAVSISNRPYSLMAHSSHWRTWSWDHNDGSAGRQKKKREEVCWLHNNCFWTETRRNVGRASYLTLVKAVWEMNKLETGFSIGSRRCSEPCKYSWSYFNHTDRVCVSGMIIRFQVNNLPQNIIHSFIKSNFGVHIALFHMVRKKAKTNSFCKYCLSAVWYTAHPLWKTNLKLTNRRGG